MAFASVKSRRILVAFITLTGMYPLGIEAAAFHPQAGGATAASKQPQAAALPVTNPFYGESPLPFHAPPFDKIKDADYLPAIEAGMAQQRLEVEMIASQPAPPTFDNTLVAMERSGRLLNRVLGVFFGVAQANTNPELQRVQENVSPRLAAHRDAIFLDSRLFQRVSKLREEQATLGLNPEQARLLLVYYQQFVKAGANLSDADKAALKKLNEEEATLSNAFTVKVLAATKDAAYTTSDKSALLGLSDAQIAAAAAAATARKQQGYIVPLQNTTQQPSLSELTSRPTRQALLKDSMERAERGGENDTRATITRLAEVRAEKAKLLGYANYAAWNLQDQMAQRPDAAIKFMDALVAPATAKAKREGADLQAVIDAQKGGFTLTAADWSIYSEQVRKAKYDLDQSEVKSYFELNRVLEDGVLYAAHQLYGISCKERKDIPVYNPDVRVFEVSDVDGKPLALFYFDYFKRDNKNGGAWDSNFVEQSHLLGDLPVIYNVANFQKPAAGQPALISFDDATTMFHEFGHGLHGIFADSEYPMLSGANVARDFVEFPSQFNEHWASEPTVFAHYAKHYQTGAPMPAELAAKLHKAATFNQGYKLTEFLAAAELDMQWHLLAPGTPIADVDAFEQAALTRTHLNLATVPPRYRSTYFLHIWANGYAAGYYAYLWSEMLDDDAYQWFVEHGGLTRANGDRFRKMILSRGNTVDLDHLYSAWRGGPPQIGPLLKNRGLTDTISKDGK